MLAHDAPLPGNVGIAPAMWNVVLPFAELTLDADLDGRRASWPIDCRDPATTSVPLRFSMR